MKLTPLDIRHKEFRRAVRGYSDEEVDVFLDEVADEFERLFQQNIEQRDNLERLEQQVKDYESLKDTLQKTLVSAQQQADETKANSHKEADLILKDAELKGRDLVSQSYADKQKVQQALIQLRQIEEDFRFKFRSLLEAHLNLLTEDEASPERSEFQGLVAQVERDVNAGEMTDEVEGGQATVGQAADGHAAGAEREFPSFLREGEFRDLISDDAAASTEEPGTVAAAEVDAHEPEEQDELPPLEPFDPERTGEGPSVEEDASENGNRPDSGVRRFLFGKKEQDEEPEDFFAREESREFEW